MCLTKLASASLIVSKMYTKHWWSLCGVLLGWLDWGAGLVEHDSWFSLFYSKFIFGCLIKILLNSIIKK